MNPLSLEQLLHNAQQRRQDLDRAGTYFLGTITEEEAERCSKTLLLMAIDRQNRPDQPITIYIQSGGGSIGGGFSIIEMMNRMRSVYKVRFNTIVLGYAYSMGAIIFQAGDRRVMGPYSTLMLHSANWTLSGEDDQIFQDMAKLSQIYRKQVSELFAHRTGKHTPRWWERYIYSGRDRFLSAIECFELGLTDEVTPRVEFPNPTPAIDRTKGILP